VSLETRKSTNFFFETTAKDFEEILRHIWILAKFILTLAAGGIVLIISSTTLGSLKRLPPEFAARYSTRYLYVLRQSVFMPLLVLDYEAWKANRHSYTRLRYIRNQTLGFASLCCFCVGYAWLIFAGGISVRRSGEVRASVELPVDGEKLTNWPRALRARLPRDRLQPYS